MKARTALIVLGAIGGAYVWGRARRFQASGGSLIGFSPVGFITAVGADLAERAELPQVIDDIGVGVSSATGYVLGTNPERSLGTDIFDLFNRG